MIKARNPVTCIILSLVTFGIYGIYWFVQIVNDINIVSGEKDAPSGVKVLLLTLVTCGIYGWLWAYKAGGQLYQAKYTRGMQGDNRQVVYLILQFVGLTAVNYILMQFELNEMAG